MVVEGVDAQEWRRWSHEVVGAAVVVTVAVVATEAVVATVAGLRERRLDAPVELLDALRVVTHSPRLVGQRLGLKVLLHGAPVHLDLHAPVL